MKPGQRVHWTNDRGEVFKGVITFVFHTCIGTFFEILLSIGGQAAALVIGNLADTDKVE